MIIKTVKVSDKGQISIPKNIRNKINIKKGDELILMQTDGKLLLEKTENLSRKMEDDFKDIMKINEDSLKDLWDNDEDNIWNDYLKK